MPVHDDRGTGSGLIVAPGAEHVMVSVCGGESKMSGSVTVKPTLVVITPQSSDLEVTSQLKPEATKRGAKTDERKCWQHHNAALLTSRPAPYW